jgi:hypothetical protein
MRRPTTALIIIALIIVVIAVAIRSRQEADTALPPSTGAESTSTDEGATVTSLDDGTTSTTSVAPVTVPATTLPPGVAVCDLYDSIEVTGSISSSDLVEASGLAVSRTTPNVVWSHNDSRGEPVLYAFNPQGADLGTFAVPGAFSIDWEDMAAGPGPEGSGASLYVADLGDNFAIRDGLIYVWRVPDLDPSELDGSFPEATPIALKMPGGSYDAEAIFVDPIDPSLYVITKSRTEALVFRGPLTSGAEPEEMQLIATLFLDAEVSGADMSADGSTIALRGYRSVWMWDRLPGSSIADTLKGDPCMAPSPDETQGESISFDLDKNYFTISEGPQSPISLVPRG